MLTALAEDHNSEAKALMHPKAAENADAAIAQMNAYLSGREVGAVEQKSINVKSSAGTAGKSKQEQVVYQVTMNDGDVIYLNVLYLSDKDGEGFTSFQLVLGAV